MQTTNLTDLQLSLEPRVVHLYGSFTGTNGSLAYDAQSGDFTAGLTVTGGTSGATGVIVSDTDDGTTGTLVLSNVVGVFQDNEAITDSSTGAATVDGVIAPADVTTAKGKGILGFYYTSNNGEMAITLTDQWGGLLAFKPIVMNVSGTADDCVVVVRSEDVAGSTKTIVIATFVGGVKQWLSTTKKLYVEIVLTDQPTSVPLGV